MEEELLPQERIDLGTMDIAAPLQEVAQSFWIHLASVEAWSDGAKFAVENIHPETDKLIINAWRIRLIAQYHRHPLGFISFSFCGFHDNNPNTLIPGGGIQLQGLGERTRIAGICMPPISEELISFQKQVVYGVLRTFLEWFDNYRQPRLPPETGNSREHQPRERTRRRAEICKSIKDANPRLSYIQVAQRATEVMGEEVTERHVQNDYKAMGWTWTPANSVNT